VGERVGRYTLSLRNVSSIARPKKERVGRSGQKTTLTGREKGGDGRDGKTRKIKGHGALKNYDTLSKLQDATKKGPEADKTLCLYHTIKVRRRRSRNPQNLLSRGGKTAEQSRTHSKGRSAPWKAKQNSVLGGVEGRDKEWLLVGELGTISERCRIRK